MHAGRTSYAARNRGFSHVRGRATALALAAAVSCSTLVASPAAALPAADAEPPAASALSGIPAHLGEQALNARVRTLLHGMSLREKVGQLFVTYAYGSSADDADERNLKEFGVATPAEVVKKYHLGGVSYFSWADNVENPKQIAHLSNGLQRSAVSSGARLPLLVSTDQEYGLVSRVGPPATQFPGAMALGAARKADTAQRAAAVGGREMRAIGINQDLAPDADVNVNPANPVIGVRSFSSSPSLAAKLTAAQVEGYQARRGGGVAAVAKHFPGHGDTDTDSHTGIPVITHSKAEWKKLDAPPFRAAVDHGVDAIMTGHLVMPALDPSKKPATLSRPILHGLLRKKLGYDGVVMTDSLQMDGVREKYGDARIPVMALQAGADVLLMPEKMDVAYDAVLDAVHDGKLSERRIDRSVTRVLRLKLRRDAVTHPFVNERRVGQVVGSADHRRTAQAVTDRTTTAVKNKDGVLPLRDTPRRMLVVGADRKATEAFGGQARRRGSQTRTMVTGEEPKDAAIDKAVQAADEHNVTVVLTKKAYDRDTTDPDGRQRRLVRQLLRSDKPVIVAAVQDPYDIAQFPSAPTYLATYSATPVAMRSLSRVVFGEAKPHGKLPVAVPSANDPEKELYSFGYGLTW